MQGMENRTQRNEKRSEERLSLGSYNPMGGPLWTNLDLNNRSGPLIYPQFNLVKNEHNRNFIRLGGFKRAKYESVDRPKSRSYDKKCNWWLHHRTRFLCNILIRVSILFAGRRSHLVRWLLSQERSIQRLFSKSSEMTPTESEFRTSNDHWKLLVLDVWKRYYVTQGRNGCSNVPKRETAIIFKDKRT